MKPVRIDPDAETELASGVDWYESRREGLGSRFLLTVEETIDRLRQYPGSGGPVPGVPRNLGTRRLLVPKFPYSVVYLDMNDEIRILAFAHANRKPGYWHPR